MKNSVFYNNLNQGYNYNLFFKKFVEICSTAQENKNALVFAMILHDFDSPHFTKLLNDQDYWKGLDRATGNSLVVFSFHHKTPLTSFINKVNYNDVVKIHSDQDPKSAIEKIYYEYFGHPEELVFPSVLFFQIKENEVIGKCIAELKSNKIEEGYNELKAYFSRVSDTLKGIKPENYSNLKEIFDLVEYEAKFLKLRKNLLGVKNKSVSLIEFVSSLMGLS